MNTGSVGKEEQFHEFLTWALGGGEWSDSRTGPFNHRGKSPCQPLAWAPEPVWTRRQREKILSLPLPGIEPRSSSL
jgi:hypothetical protein